MKNNHWLGQNYYCCNDLALTQTVLLKRVEESKDWHCEPSGIVTLVQVIQQTCVNSWVCTAIETRTAQKIKLFRGPFLPVDFTILLHHSQGFGSRNPQLTSFSICIQFISGFTSWGVPGSPPSGRTKIFSNSHHCLGKFREILCQPHPL